MSGLAVFWLTLFGLAGLMPFPAPGWLGLRFLAAFFTLITAIFFLHFAASVPLSAAAWSLAAVAAAGLLVITRRRLRVPLHGRKLLHPVFIFPAVAAAFVGISGLSYDPISWDELSNWLGLTQHVVLADTFFSPRVYWTLPGYTPGWPIALAFPQLILGHYADVNSALVPFLMHVGLLGLLFDVIAHGLGQSDCSPGKARLAAWAMILLVLGLEASWKLVPLNLLVEKPQIYVICAMLALGSVASDRTLGWAALNIHAGLLLVGGYLIKIAMLSMVGPFGILWAWMAWRRGVFSDLKALGLGLVLTLAPLILAYALWRNQAPVNGCLSNPMVMFSALMSGDLSAEKAMIYSRLAEAMGGYLMVFKLPLTVVSVAGLALAASRRETAPVVIVLLLWLALYLFTLFNYYVYCYTGYDAESLTSWDRFTRLPLRTVHVMGIILPVLAFAGIGARMIRRRQGMIVLAVLVVMMAVFQAKQLRFTLIEIGQRATEAPEWIASGRKVRDEAEAIAALVAEKPELGRNVLMLSQGDDGYLRLKGFFHALRRFELAPRSQFALVPKDIWTIASDEKTVTGILLNASLVWPVALDPWMREVLAPLIDGPKACHEDPGRFFLVPSQSRLLCVNKR